MVRIRRFGVIRTATVVAVMYALIVAVIFIPIALLVAVARTTAGPDGGTPGMLPAAAGAGAVIVFGLVAIVGYAVVGWIFTALACLVYNFAARFAGGIEVEVDRIEPTPLAPVPGGWGQQTGWASQQPATWSPPPTTPRPTTPPPAPSTTPRPAPPTSDERP